MQGDHATNKRPVDSERESPAVCFALPLFARHNFQDGLIRLAHALPGKAAHIRNGIFHTASNDTVAAAELLIVAVHMVSHYTCFHSRCNLCCAGGLCPVAYGAGNDNKRVYNRVCDYLVISSQQVRYEPKPQERAGP